MKIDYTFHSHTFRCGHAVGDIEDYVLNAINHGYKIYGVSDHVFLPGINEPTIRGKYELLDEYIDVFNKAKTKYEKDIKLYLGFECEYTKRFENYYWSLLKEKNFDYLICGQHHYFGVDGKRYFYNADGVEGTRDISSFKDDIIEAMRSGLFLYIAHPDIYFAHTTEITPLFKEVTKEIIMAAIKYDAVLEINIHGLLRNHIRNGKEYVEYPCEYFWEEVAKTNIKVVLGGDYHNPNEIGNSEYSLLLDELLKKSKIKLSDIGEIYKEYRERIDGIISEEKQIFLSHGTSHRELD